MSTIVYLLLGVAFMGGLFYALMQVTARQRRLTAELTRLEQLAAEVALNAEAILDRVDERTHRLHELMERAEAMAEAAASEPAPAQAPVPEAVPEPAPEVSPEPAAPTSIEKYQAMRTAVWQKADMGKSPSEIAQEMGIPRGEVQLLLNLRTKKVTA
ncbi:MAG TPA: hypothetical protein VD902_21975 [Symbiobacteriaceae bacterium]|nr:hypothetical protein [Symbiobacteriaceae bacterium]